VEQNLSRGESRARNGGQERHGIVAGANPEAEIQNRAHRQHRELDSLEKAEWTGKLMQHQLCRECNQ
jgi:hypothetical protein